MKIEIKYGETSKYADLSGNIEVLGIPRVERLSDVRSEIEKALEMPIGTPPLREIARGKRDACIVVSDTTRPVPNSIILPPILKTLKKAGIIVENITILIATGTHDPVPSEMFEELLGDEVVKSGVRIVNHDAFDKSKLVDMGMAVHGCPAILNELYVRSDLKICTGLIEPHFMAGFSGGRKSICPGITGIETLKVFHGVDAMAHPLSKNCVLDGNPVDEIARDVARIAGCDFILNVTLDDRRRVTGIFAGDLFKAHERGCEFAKSYSIVEIERPADIVVTSNGGYPLDQNYYQTAKGLVSAAEILRKDGVIIMVSECRYGLGKSSFKRLLKELKEKGIKDFLDAHRTSETFESDQWEVQKISQVLEKTRNIFLLSDLDDEDIALTFAKRIDSIEDGMDMAKRIVGANPFIVVIPDGPYVIGKIK